MPEFVAYTDGDLIVVKRDRDNQEKVRSTRILNMNLIEFVRKNIGYFGKNRKI